MTEKPANIHRAEMASGMPAKQAMEPNPLLRDLVWREGVPLKVEDGVVQQPYRVRIGPHLIKAAAEKGAPIDVTLGMDGVYGFVAIAKVAEE